MYAEDSNEWKEFIEAQKNLVNMIISDKWADDLKEIKEIVEQDDGITKKNGVLTSSMGF